MLLFEGSEKKLEIILYADSESVRSNKNIDWHAVVSACKASVISQVSYQDFDAYLLSESSLFVFDHKITFITCGRTELYRVMPLLLEILDSSDIQYVFYCRKRLTFPGEQISDFEQEVESIEMNGAGSSYRLGPANQEHVHVFIERNEQTGRKQIKSDFTLEILMVDPSEEAMAPFLNMEGKSHVLLREESGIADLYRQYNAQFDDYCFDPYGYSMNGEANGHYFTIHVTPQKACSYVSFETTVREEDYSQTIRQVFDVFEPRRVLMVFYDSQDERRFFADMPDYAVDEETLLKTLEYNVHSFHLERKV